MSTYLFNFLLIKHQLVTFSIEELKDLYKGQEKYERFVLWVAAVASHEEDFFLLHPGLMDKVAQYIDCYRWKYPYGNETIEDTNTIISVFNNLSMLSKKEIKYRRKAELVNELRVRGLKITSYEKADFSFIYYNDVNNIAMLQNGDVEKVIENPFLADTIHYMCLVKDVFKDDPELLKTVFTVLHMAEDRNPELIEMTRKEKRTYQKSMKREMKHMKRMGYVEEDK